MLALKQCVGNVVERDSEVSARAWTCNLLGV
jgi:hypothetical protein